MTPLVRTLAALLAVTLLVALAPVCAQQLSGRIQGIPVEGRTLVLSVTDGAEQRPIDSLQLSANGRFSFASKAWPNGFYQIALGDTDRVDILLGAADPVVELRFSGSPLQEHVEVVRSVENTRLWRYKLASRKAQQQLAEIRRQREATAPLDAERIGELDRQQAQVEAEKRTVLDTIIAEDSTGFFAKVVLADRQLMAAIPEGARRIAAVFPWSQGDLVRTSIYPKAVMAYLQQIPFGAPGGLTAAVDSLMHWSAGDTAAWRYSRYLLARLFHEYGPEEVADHVVERYITGSGALQRPERRLRDMVAERLRSAVGATAPDVLLPRPGGGTGVPLREIITAQRYTLLFFYSSSCDHCHQQMPGLRAIFEATDRAGLAMVGIALDADGDEFQQTIAQEALPWPSFSALNGWGCPVAKAFGIRATPTLVLLDDQGTIVAKPRDHEALSALLGELLR